MKLNTGNVAHSAHRPALSASRQMRLTMHTTARTLALVLVVSAVLAGCARPSTETFEGVEGQSDVIVFEGDLVTPADTSDADVSQPTATVLTIPAPNLQATPTTMVINPSGSDVDNDDLPTRRPTTQPGQVQSTETTQPRITPGAPVQQSFSATRATASGSASGSGLNTPTALPTEQGEPCTYIVQPGQTLFAIARDNNTTLAELLAINNLSESSIIQPSQELILPDCLDSENVGVPATTGATGATGATSATAVATSNLNFITHVVKSGETLYAIAIRYGLYVSDITAANPSINPDNLSIGQEILIPRTDE